MGAAAHPKLNEAIGKDGMSTGVATEEFNDVEDEEEALKLGRWWMYCSGIDS